MSKEQPLVLALLRRMKPESIQADEAAWEYVLALYLYHLSLIDPGTTIQQRPSPRHVAWVKTQRPVLQYWYERGWSLRALAVVYGVSHGTIGTLIEQKRPTYSRWMMRSYAIVRGEDSSLCR